MVKESKREVYSTQATTNTKIDKQHNLKFLMQLLKKENSKLIEEKNHEDQTKINEKK